MKRRGSTLLLSLALLTLTLLLGLGFLTRRSSEYQVATLKVALVQARQLAMAGLEDARAKLDHDTHFPPVGDLGQVRFTYAELVYDLDETTPLGHYEVCVDQTYRQDPYQVIRLESTGWAGRPARASYRVQAELDASRQIRGGSGTILTFGS